MSASKIFEGKIRDGKFGNLSNEDYKVIYDPELKYAYLEPQRNIDYTNENYRLSVNDSSLVDDYFRLHDHEQFGYFDYIKKEIKRGQIIADCGCGAGSMLDLLSGFSKELIAIEPFEGFHNSLSQRSYKVFSTIEEANKVYNAKVDLSLSIHVIEHTESPFDYVRGIFHLLNDNGVAIIITPNLDDILLKLYPQAYAPFFYRIVHNYYFTGAGLEILGLKAGFRKASCFYYQEFGISNMIQWLKEGKPKGNNNFEVINETIDLHWKHFLETTGQSYNVGAVLRK